MINTVPVLLPSAIRIAVTYLKAGLIPMFIAAPGIGKTAGAKEVARLLGAELFHLRLNNTPPEEAIGLQFIDNESKTTVRLPPKWVPKADGSDGPRLIFLDEFNQAPDEYRKGIMSALLEGYIGENTLPDNCYFMAASNSEEDGTNVYHMDRATADRFGIIKINANVDLWANDYAQAKNINVAIVAFLRNREDLFETSQALIESGQIIGGSPRTWEAASCFIAQALEDKLSEEEIKAGLMGKLGETVTNSFWSVQGEILKLPTLKKLLAMKKADRAKNSPKTMDALWMYGQSMIWQATDAKTILKIFTLLDDFKPTAGIPYHETRTHIQECILERARLKHNVDCATIPEIGQHILRWEAEARMPANDKGPSETAKTVLKAVA